MQTLVELLRDIKLLCNREAVRWSNGLRTWTATYSDLYGKVGAVTRYFDQLGLKKGDRVLISGENRLEWIAVFWACIARGIEAVPVDYRFSPALVDRIRNECHPKLVIDNAALDAIAALREELQFAPGDVTSDDVVEIVYTSGTTGEPKGIVHRHRNICANLEPFRREIAKYLTWARPFQPIRILDLLPLSHMFGQSQGLFIPLFLQGSAVFTSETHPAKIIRFVRENRISVIVCVPRILENLRNEVKRFSQEAAADQRARSVMGRLWAYRKIHAHFGWKFWAFVVGGAKVDPDLEEFWKHLGFAVIQGYGLTEASPVIAVNHPFDTRTGSLGKVVAGQDVTLAQDGEILVRGESVTTTDGKWLHTGDYGEIDAEGRLYYRGRKKDMIVTAEGLNVHPEDVETVLNSLHGIRDSAVVARGTNREEVHAVLLLNNGDVDVASLIRLANERLEPYQRIRSWSVWPDDDFPRTTSTLKIKRGDVAKLIHAQKSSGPDSAKRPDLSAMSSLERVELLSELENKYQVELDEDSFSKLSSTVELDEWVRRQEISAARIDREKPASDWARSFPIVWFRRAFQCLVALPLYRRYLPLTVDGLENLKGIEPPVIFAPNHVSHLDVQTIYTALPSTWRPLLTPAMMKDHFKAYFEPSGRSVKEIGVAGISYFLACLLYNAYPLPHQMSGTRRALEYTGELISRGYCPVVFPEGLRSPDGTLHPLNPGVAMMSIRLRAPIVPIRTTGLYEVYSVHDSWPRRGSIHVHIGAPLLFSAATTYEEATGQLEAAIKSL